MKLFLCQNYPLIFGPVYLFMRHPLISYPIHVPKHVIKKKEFDKLCLIFTFVKPNRVLFCTLSGRSSKQDVCWCWKSINQSWIILHILVSHFAFSSNLFHGHIVQKYIDQMSLTENKKCCHEKVFGIKPTSNLATFEQEGP